MLVFSNGIVTGCDVVGGTFDGIYEFNPQTGMLDMKVTAKIPAGVALVTGVAAQTTPMVFEIVSEVPAELDVKHPVTVNLPGGEVVVIYHKLRDLPGS